MNEPMVSIKIGAGLVIAYFCIAIHSIKGVIDLVRTQDFAKD